MSHADPKSQSGHPPSCVTRTQRFNEGVLRGCRLEKSNHPTTIIAEFLSWTYASRLQQFDQFCTDRRSTTAVIIATNILKTMAMPRNAIIVLPVLVANAKQIFELPDARVTNETGDACQL